MLGGLSTRWDRRCRLTSPRHPAISGDSPAPQSWRSPLPLPLNIPLSTRGCAAPGHLAGCHPGGTSSGRVSPPCPGSAAPTTDLAARSGSHPRHVLCSGIQLVSRPPPISSLPTSLGGPGHRLDHRVSPAAELSSRGAPPHCITTMVVMAQLALCLTGLWTSAFNKDNPGFPAFTQQGVTGDTQHYLLFCLATSRAGFMSQVSCCRLTHPEAQPRPQPDESTAIVEVVGWLGLLATTPPLYKNFRSTVMSHMAPLGHILHVRDPVSLPSQPQTASRLSVTTRSVGPDPDWQHSLTPLLRQSQQTGHQYGPRLQPCALTREPCIRQHVSWAQGPGVHHHSTILITAQQAQTGYRQHHLVTQIASPGGQSYRSPGVHRK